MDTKYKLHPNVQLGRNAYLGDYVIIGVPPRGYEAGELKTILGDHAIIRSHSVIYAGNKIGNHFQTGHGVMIRENNQIGDHVSIGTHSVIEHHVRLGDNVRIHTNVFIPEYSLLEDDAWVGPNVVFTNARYPLSKDVKSNLESPHLLPGAKIGANATLLPGIEIGRDALIGAGSVVTEDVPQNAIVVGNPARIVGDIAKLDAYALVDDL
ncbi:MAG: DapH/DapD/GlmU-related protein [Chloroflexota bacterium]|nr:DapH/DapD/GlmU-related protein [Chloroflexota bacterium]